MIKVLIGAGVFLGLVWLALKVKSGASSSSTSSLIPGLPIADEGFTGGGVAVDNPGGTFLGNTADTRSPINAVVAPGATKIINNPVLEWQGNIGNLPLPGPAREYSGQVPADFPALAATSSMIRVGQRNVY